VNKKEYDRQYYQNLSPEQKAKKNSCSKLPEVRLRKKEWYQSKKKEKQEIYQKHRQEVIEYLQEKHNYIGCVGCGSQEQLEIDHIDPSLKKCDPAKSFGAKTITPRIWEEINKCQLLCYDCHRVKTGIQFSK
tara:strand:- start:1618 stop:2013 length:396 start_codon:yes stop_codon:yes gene_type:complete